MLVSVVKGIDHKMGSLKNRKGPKLTAKFYIEMYRLNQESGKALVDLAPELVKINETFLFPKTEEKVEINNDNEIVLDKKVIVQTLIETNRLDDLLKFVDMDSTSLKRIDGGAEMVEKNTIKVNTTPKVVVKKMSAEEVARAMTPKPKKEKKAKIEKPAKPAESAKKAAGPKPASKKPAPAKE
jgi:hypothetical protein